MKTGFGYQLLVDLYGCSKKNCENLLLSYSFLEDIVRFLKMQKQSPPVVIISDKQKYPSKAGISGWVPLIESSVVIHTLSKQGFISVDVYSCRSFKVQETVRFIQSYFKSKKVETQFIKRGISYRE